MPSATINGHRIHYLDSQALDYKIVDSRLPIIMIHGLGGSENFYMPVIPVLDGHRCIAMSTYGSALSKSEGESLTMDGLAADVIGMMDHLGITKAIIVGHSMGGPMALTVAVQHPDRVAGVVALGPTNPRDVKPEVFTGRIRTALKGVQQQFRQPFVTKTDQASDGMEPLADSIPQAATNANSTPLQRAIIREMLMSQDPKLYASLCQVIVDMKDPGFSSIKSPVLILAGDEDKSAPLAGCQYIHEQLGSQQKELKVMKEVGHWHAIEAGEETAREIARFAAQVAQ